MSGPGRGGQAMDVIRLPVALILLVILLHLVGLL